MRRFFQRRKPETGNDTSSKREKKLPVKIPVITTYTQHAHLLSILMNYPCTFPWIMSNYIQIYINKDYKYRWGDFYFPGTYDIRPSDTCPWLISQKLHRDLVAKKWKSVIDFVVECIDSGTYVHTMLNYFYVPLSQRYKKARLHHDILVYGYNLKRKVLFVSDFFKEGIYGSEELAFSDFRLAFSTCDQTTNQDWLNKLVYLYRFNQGYEEKYHFSPESVIRSINRYVSCEKPEYWDIYNYGDDAKNLDFGMDFYSTLMNYISNTSDARGEMDIRPFVLFHDHKKLMNLRIKFLLEEGYLNKVTKDIIVEYSDIEARTGRMPTAILKYNITRDKESMVRLVDKLLKLRSDETEILTLLCKTDMVCPFSRRKKNIT